MRSLQDRVEAVSVMHRVRWFVAAFGSGFGVMASELVLPRFMAPLFGASIDTWAAVLVVTMCCLSVGYLLGAHLAHRAGAVAALAACLLGAAVWLASIRWWGPSAMLSLSSLGVRGGSLASALLLLGPTMVASGMVFPVLVELHAGRSQRPGAAAGRLTAFSTIGSMTGGLVTAYLLVPAVGTAAVLSVIAVLYGAVAVMVASTRRSVGLGAAAFGLVVPMALSLPTPVAAAQGHRVLAAHETPFMSITVEEHGDLRLLYMDGVAHAVVDRTSLENRADTYFALELARLVRPRARRALVLGLGAGLIPTAFESRGGLVTDVVELDPSVVDVARTWFGFDPQGDVFIEDARRFLARTDRTYDLVVHDLMFGDGQVWYAMTAEAFRACRARMTPEGLLVVNAVGAHEGSARELLVTLVNTLRTSFDQVRVFPAGRGSKGPREFGNFVVLASNGPLDLPTEASGLPPDLEEYWYATRNRRPMRPEPEELERAGSWSDDHCNVEDLAGPAWRRARIGAIRADRARFEARLIALGGR